LTRSSGQPYTAFRSRGCDFPGRAAFSFSFAFVRRNMLRRTRRRSAHITLVLLGAAALTACGDDADRRDLYASKQDCVQDWGDEQKCEPAPPGTTSSRPHSGGGYFYGPAYRSSSHRSSGSSLGSARSGSRAVSSSSFSRGGFGHSASSHSSGG
jgi:uncharacterized protein YgiB involved in biofilm formation